MRKSAIQPCRYVFTVLLLLAPCHASYAGISQQKNLQMTLGQVFIQALKYEVQAYGKRLVIEDIQRRFEYYFLEPRVYGGGGVKTEGAAGDNPEQEASGKSGQKLRGIKKKLSWLKGKLFGSSGDDVPPDPRVESSLPDVVQWTYFDLDKFRGDLQSIREQYKRDHRTIILSFDIDDTFYRSPQKHSDSDVFYREQRQIHKVFDQWLHQSDGFLPVILIFNTAREYDGTDAFALMSSQGLPAPHILIYNNGLTVRINPKHIAVAELQAIGSHAEEVSARLKTALDANDAAISLVLTPHRDSIQETTTTLFRHGKAIKTKTSYFCAEHRAVVDFFRYIKSPCENADLGKSFSAHNGTPALYYYDRQVNKGMALVMVLQQLLPVLPVDARLYTAGDDMADLAMMFLTLLTNAYRVEEQRREGLVHRDLENMGVSAEEFRRISDFWRAAVVPETMHTMLQIILDRTDLMNHSRLYRIPEASLPGIMGVIASDLKPAEGVVEVEVY